MANYVSADWHGAQWAWEAVKSFLKEEDRLYFLGDAIDRGPGLDNDGGWSMLKEMLADERVFYLLGNHEDMLYNAYFMRDGDAEWLNRINGGAETLAAARSDPNAESMIRQFNYLPLTFEYKRPDGKTIFMSHSGSTNIDSRKALLWDRSEYFTRDNWTDYDYVIGGHTRAEHIIKDLQEANEFYWTEKKYDIQPYEDGAYWITPWRCTVDCGTILSNQIVLLNLDTFEEHIFS